VLYSSVEGVLAMETLGGIFVVLFLVACVFLVIFLRGKDKKLATARAEMASLRGWRYSAGGGARLAYNVEGEGGGGSWRVECRWGKKNSRGWTKFTCREAATGGGVVAICAADMAGMFKSPIGRTIAGWAMALGGAMGMETGPMQRLMEHFVEVEPGGAAFKERFAVLATDESAAKRAVTAGSCEALMSYAPATTGGRITARSLSIIWSEEGMVITQNNELYSPQSLASFIELGITLAKESRGGGW
jgi:hypothetical protein